MSIMDMLDDAKRSLADFKRKCKFKKANQSRKEAAELQSSMAKCRGQLEICQKEFKRTISAECRNIAEGRKLHADTLIQEQTLWDAAIGYMLVKDAIFSLKSINSYDSVSHAYDMLDAAVAQMSGKKNKLLDLPHIKSSKTRNYRGYITSDSAIKEKKEILDRVFEKLKMTGDIDQCLESAYAADGRASAFAGEGGDNLAERLSRLSDDDDDLYADLDDIEDLKDIHTPDD